MKITLVACFSSYCSNCESNDIPFDFEPHMKLSKTLDGIEYGDGEQGEQGPGGHISSQKSLQGAGEHGVMRFLEGGHGVMGPLEDGQGVIGVGTRGREAN